MGMISMEDNQLTVLVCDDSMLVRKQLRDLLEPMGCRVLEAGNGLEAVHLYRQENPKAVFLDIVMPEMDGIHALEAIREADRDAKVIMVSSTGTASYLKDALRLGACNFIQKPFTKEQLSQVILAIRK